MWFYIYIVTKPDSCFSSTPLKCGKNQGTAMPSCASCILGALQAISLQTRCVYITPLSTPLPQLLIFSFAAKRLAPLRTLRSRRGSTPRGRRLPGGGRGRRAAACASPACRDAALPFGALRFCHQNQKSA